MTRDGGAAPHLVLGAAQQVAGARVEQRVGRRARGRALLRDLVLKVAHLRSRAAKGSGPGSGTEKQSGLGHDAEGGQSAPHMGMS